MNSIRKLMSAVGAVALSAAILPGPAQADVLDHYRPAVLTKAERALQRGHPERTLKLLDAGGERLRSANYRAEGHGLVCRAYYEQAQYAQAERACNRAVALGGGALAWSHLNNRGVMRLLLDRPVEALEDFHRAALLNPEAWPVRRNQAVASEILERDNLRLSGIR